MKTLWKFLLCENGNIVSKYDKSVWKIGEWRQVDKPTKICEGLNACKYPQDALGYVAGDVIAKVQIKGAVIADDDKCTCEYMRIIKAWHWEKKDSVALAIYSAFLCLKYFEDKYPDDKKPRKAIEAAQKWLENPTEENRMAAAVAWAAADASWAAAARAAAAAARAAAARAAAAAWAAADAARAAAAAARAAADAAWVAAAAADAAAADAYAAAAAYKAKINKWVVSHVKKIKEISEKV